MIDTHAALIAAIAAGQSFKYLFFWGPAVSDSVTKTCLSQWFVDGFKDAEGNFYPTAEHFMMAGKARLFDDEAILAQILAAPDPRTARALGRKVKDFDQDRWVAERDAIVTEGNRLKFTQHPALKEFLIGTGTQILVEAAPRDRIWGIGLGAKNPKASNPVEWRGQNRLGFCLMRVRRLLS